MIQRKQTLFLLAVTIIAIVTLFTPFMEVKQDIFIMSLSLSTVFSGMGLNSNAYYPLAFNLLVIILSIATIFLFKNRNLQYKLANMIVLFNIIIVALLFLMTYNVSIVETSFTFGAFLPLVGTVLAFLAGYFIKKDEQLVRSADRIR